MAVTITRTNWTDDDGSGTTGTVINNAVKTELYGQIDTAIAALEALVPASPVTLTGAQVLTNKQITPRVQAVTSAATVTPAPDTNDVVVITAQAAAVNFANPTPVVNVVQGQKLIVRIKDNGTARAITWDTQYRAIGTPLPSTTVISKTLYLGLIYNVTDTKWDMVAAAQEA